MKSLELFLTAILFFAFGFAKAQSNYNPWEKYGYTPPKALTLSNGKYQEFFDNDTIVQIGSVMFNTVTNQIVAFVVYDTIRSEANLEPHIISRWLSPDPLAQEYPAWSPYNYAGDNPILNIDPDGRDFFAANQGAQATILASFSLAFGQNSMSAFSFDQNNKLSIDQSKISADLKPDQSYLLNKLSKNIVNNPDILFTTGFSSNSETQTIISIDENGKTVMNSNININQSNFMEKMTDTKSGLVKSSDPNYTPTNNEKAGTALFHEVGHASEHVDGNKVGSKTNDKRTVGFENVFRRIIGLDSRIGNKHGAEKKDGTIKKSHKGVENPTQ